MATDSAEVRSLALTPTWSVATVLTIFVAVSLVVERSIHRLSTWLRKTKRKPLLEAVEKMKEELMLLGFISLLLTATSSTISNICIPSKFYDESFAPCTRADIDEEKGTFKDRRLYVDLLSGHSFRRMLNILDRNTCRKDHEQFVSYQGLEQLHRFIFVMAVTHISYSCLTMLLAIVKVVQWHHDCVLYEVKLPNKRIRWGILVFNHFDYTPDFVYYKIVLHHLAVEEIHGWRPWEDEARADRHDVLTEETRESILRRQSTFVKIYSANPLFKSRFLIWVICFFRQFGDSVVRADYLTLRKGFIMNHNLSPKYDFHSYMIQSMEEEFQRIVGVGGPLWGFVVAFMLFNIKGSNLYFWIATIPIMLLILVGAKLQHVIATLSLETSGITGFFAGTKLRPRDDLFWLKKPELLLFLIHFILFQNAFELASFFWFWWQFGYNSCFIKKHLLVYLRLILGFAGQFLCSYSTLPLYALVTQMGTNYKAAMIPQRIRETIHGWKKSARRRRKLGMITDDSTIHTDTSTVMSLEEDDRGLADEPSIMIEKDAEVELCIQQSPVEIPSHLAANETTSSRVGTPLLRPCASVSTKTANPDFHDIIFERSMSLPARRKE